MKKVIALLSLIVLAIFYGCNEQKSVYNPAQPAQPEQTAPLSEADARLDILAQSLALALNDEQVTTALEKKMTELETREKIQILSQWAKESIDGASIARRMVSAKRLAKQTASNQVKTEKDVFEMMDSFDPLLDVYFPVPAHRENWMENREDLLVAYPPQELDDMEWETITAYDLQGNKHLLDAATPPDAPVLVITRCEHGGKHEIIGNPILPDQLPCGDCGGGGGGGGGTPPPTWKIRITDIRINNDNEGWPNGSPEIYVRSSHPNNLVQPDWRRTDLPDANEEKLYLESESWLPAVVYSEPQSTNVYNGYFGTDIEVWEDDVSSGDDNLETIWWFDEPGTFQTDFIHDASFGYNNRDWYFGVSGDADVRMYVHLDNPQNP